MLYLEVHAGAELPAEEGNMVFDICQLVNLETKWARNHLVVYILSLVLFACTVYWEVYLPNLNIDVF